MWAIFFEESKKNDLIIFLIEGVLESTDVKMIV